MFASSSTSDGQTHVYTEQKRAWVVQLLSLSQ